MSASFRLLGVGVVPYVLPLAAPLPTPHGRTRHRRGWLLRLEAECGIGWGDAAPWPGFGSGEAKTDADLERLHALAGTVSDDREALLGELRLGPEARHALDLALRDLEARRSALPLAHLLFDRRIAHAKSHTLVIGDARPRGARCLKVKVGARSLDDDDALLGMLRAASPEAELRLDAGGRWSLGEAERALERLSRHRLAWVEQPVASLEDFARLRSRTQVALAVDESLRDATDLAAVVGAGASAVVLKPMFLGGIGPTLALAIEARAAGLEVVITNALESAIGRAGALHLAAGLPGHHGLGSALEADLAELPPRAGDRIPLPHGPGLGIRPALSATGIPVREVATPRRSAEKALLIPSPLASAASARPEHPALVVAGETVDYGALLAAAQRRAGGLAARGIAAGDRVALSGPPDRDWVVSFHALCWLGAAVAPLPNGPRGSRVASAVEATFRLEGPVPDGEPSPERFWPIDETRLVIASSGTTGQPKAVALTTAQLVFSAFASAIRLGLSPADRWLGCLPLHHIGGLSVILRSVFFGTTAVLQPRFDPRAVSRAIDDDGVTIISLVPEMLARLLEARTRFPASLRAILVGGAALDDALRARCRALGLPVAASWGMTEAASQLATTFVGDLEPGAPPLPFVRICADEDRLCAEGPLVGGSLVTQDRGSVRDGRVHVLGRTDDVIVSGGAKIDPSLVEAVLARHPGVREVAVVGVPSARWGARPIAAVVAPEVSDGELAAHCRAHLAAFEVPDRFVRLGALPRTSLGKIARGWLAIEEGHDDERR